MKHFFKLTSIAIAFIFFSCNADAQQKDNYSAKNKSPLEDNYIFFLHNKFLELNPDGTFAPEYGVKAEYHDALESFRKDKFIVISEKRKPKTDAIEYAKKVVSQIDSLIAKGVKADHITIIGTSNGGYIAQFVSTFAKNPDLNFVFIGSYQETDLKDIPEINFCGNILTIYEKSDEYGVSAIKRKETSTLKINHFKEIELNTGLKHGFLYLASDNWIKPAKMWAKRDY